MLVSQLSKSQPLEQSRGTLRQTVTASGKPQRYDIFHVSCYSLLVCAAAEGLGPVNLTTFQCTASWVDTTQHSSVGRVLAACVASWQAVARHDARLIKPLIVYAPAALEGQLVVHGKTEPEPQGNRIQSKRRGAKDTTDSVVAPRARKMRDSMLSRPSKSAPKLRLEQVRPRFRPILPTSGSHHLPSSTLKIQAMPALILRLPLMQLMGLLKVPLQVMSCPSISSCRPLPPASHEHLYLSISHQIPSKHNEI